MKIDPLQRHRILLIDDNVAIHEDYRKILVAPSPHPDLDDDEAALFGNQRVQTRFPAFEIDSAYQGQEGLDLIEKGHLEGQPYSLAFVDVRMPPGLDGIETSRRILESNTDLQIVICTAYSDYSLQEVVKALGYSDRIVILKKPFDNVEVLLLAIAMTEKWRLQQESKHRVEEYAMIIEERTLILESIGNR